MSKRMVPLALILAVIFIQALSAEEKKPASPAPAETPTAKPEAANPAPAINAGSDAIETAIAEAYKRFREGLAAKPLPSDARILLSEGLFSAEDGKHLGDLLGDDKVTKVASFDEMKIMTAQEDIDKETAERTRACIMTKSDFERLRRQRGIAQDRDRLRATILVIDDLKGANYLHLQDVVGLVKAMMEKDASAVRVYMRFVFAKVMIDGRDVSDDELEDFLKKNDCLELAIRAALKFRPVVPVDTDEELLNKYKLMVENYLIQA